MKLKLFYALMPPARESQQAIQVGACLQDAHGFRGNPIGIDRLHRTLACCFSPRMTLKEAIARAKMVGAAMRVAPFAVTFNRSRGFAHADGRFPFVLDSDQPMRELMAFRRELRWEIIRAGFERPENFHPHITLVWADRCVEDNPCAAIGWTVQEFVLILSYQGESRYEVLGRWSLQEFHTAGQVSALA